MSFGRTNYISWSVLECMRGPSSWQNWLLLRHYLRSNFPITPETWLRINKDYATLQFFWIDDKNISFLKERNLDCTNTRKWTITLFKSKHIYLEFKSLFNCNTTLIIDKFLLFLFTQLSPYKTNLLKHFHRFKSN